MTGAGASKPYAKKWPYWLLIAAALVVPAFSRAVRAYLFSKFGKGTVDWGDVIFIFFDWLVLGFLAPFVYVLARHYPIRRERVSRAVWAHLLGSILFTLIWAASGVLIGRLLHRLPDDRDLVRGYQEWLMLTMTWSIFLYPLMVGCVYAFTYYHEARERESQQARLAAQLAEARLSALRMQLNPHFLFNSLNAITVLVRARQSDAAAQMLEALSDILRLVLQNKPRGETTLDEEISFIEMYLAIEQVRFPDRLEVRWAIEPGTRDILVPEFILQPLVENAIRHGISQRTEAGIIEIAAKETNGYLALSVTDNGPGYALTIGEGLGLSNTRERLETLYRDAGQLDLSSRKGTTTATVRFPIRRKGDE